MASDDMEAIEFNVENLIKRTCDLECHIKRFRRRQGNRLETHCTLLWICYM